MITAEELGLWTSPEPEHSGWVAMPYPHSNAVRVWKKGCDSYFFWRRELTHDMSGTSDMFDAASFAAAYFDVHKEPLCKDHSPVGSCTLPEGHEGRHKRDVDSITFYWETTVEA